MKLTLRGAALACAAIQVGMQWIELNRSPAGARTHWVLVGAMLVFYVGLGAFAAARGRRWSAPLFPVGAACLAAALIGGALAVVHSCLVQQCGALVLGLFVGSALYAFGAGALGALALILYRRMAGTFVAAS